jgi:hypothetical protein
MGHSLTLISQSVDSKNHIYLCMAVIAGALLSLAGIFFFDAFSFVQVTIMYFVIAALGLRPLAVDTIMRDAAASARLAAAVLDLCDRLR